MDNKIVVIAAVAAVIVIAAAAVLLTKSSDDGFEIDDYPGTYLAVLGNAEPDLVIDTEDIKAIEKFINDKTAESSSYKYKDYYMYDANYDKKIDQADADIVAAMVRAQSTGDWSECQFVYYVNVDKVVAKYDMTISDKVITLIAPPLDTVLAMGGRDLVVGTDDRITTGKYHPEYAKTLDFDTLIDVGNCNEPSTEQITKASVKYGGVNVVCGRSASYGPTMEKTFAGTDIQVIRIGSWEYGTTLYGYHTLAFLLKLVDESQEFYDGYKEIKDKVQDIVESVSPSKKAAGKVGAAAAYGYKDELDLLGLLTGEYANLMLLDPYASASDYLGGESGSHGTTITTEGISAMYQQDHLKNLLVMIGTPFQVATKTETGDAQSSQANLENMYDMWSDRIGTQKLDGLRMCITGYSFSSGVSEVLNQLIHCYWLYNDEFLAYFHCTTQKEAQDVIAGYVDWYCESIGIDDAWSFYGEGNGGKAGTLGMNLLYCGEGSELNMMYGLEGGVI